MTLASDDPDKKYLTTFREFTDLVFWNTWKSVTWLFKAYVVTLAKRCFFLCYAGQRGTMALKLDCTYEEHLCVVTLTGRARGAQTHPLASYVLVRFYTAFLLLSGKYRCFVMTKISTMMVVLSAPVQSLTQTLRIYHYH